MYCMWPLVGPRRERVLPFPRRNGAWDKASGQASWWPWEARPGFQGLWPRHTGSVVPQRC